MDTYFGIILFSWIVIAPTIGLLASHSMDRRDRRAIAPRDDFGRSPPRASTDRTTLGNA
jgi:hypothetical protein